jgi:hypothetical protein
MGANRSPVGAGFLKSATSVNVGDRATAEATRLDLRRSALPKQYRRRDCVDGNDDSGLITDPWKGGGAGSRCISKRKDGGGRSGVARPGSSVEAVREKCAPIRRKPRHEEGRP